MLENAGRSRAVIQQALAIDRAEASKLVSVAKSVPGELIRAIGKAPKIGRRRWQEFAEALNDTAALERAHAVAALPVFTNLDSDARFARAIAAANRQEAKKVAAPPSLAIKDAEGHILAQIRSSDRDVKVTLAESSGNAFAQFLAARLPDLFHEFNTFDAG
jgi:ParB family chromosome partitioning protein